MKEHSAFWDKHPGIIWSNRQAPDSARIRAALLSPRFYQILDIATEFGLKRVVDEWRIVKTSGDSRVGSAAPSVERCLAILKKAFKMLGYSANEGLFSVSKGSIRTGERERESSKEAFHRVNSRRTSWKFKSFHNFYNRGI